MAGISGCELPAILIWLLYLGVKTKLVVARDISICYSITHESNRVAWW
jgi:hypothetical protein